MVMLEISRAGFLVIRVDCRSSLVFPLVWITYKRD
jgi:hypothetical protein